MTTESPVFTALLYSLNDIGYEPSNKGKERLLGTYLEDERFQKLTTAMLDPMVSYGITDFIPAKASSDQPATFEELLDNLNSFRKRTLTGNFARSIVGDLIARGVPEDLMLRILNKDPKAGFGVATVNKVKPKFLPEFPYMRCSLPPKSNLAKFPWEKGVYSQLKSDGMFISMSITSNISVTMLTRQGRPLPQVGFEDIYEEAMKLTPNTQVHGEMTVMKDGKVLPRQIGNGMINSVIQGGTWDEGCTPMLSVWDQIPLDCAVPGGKCMSPYRYRFLILEAQVFGALKSLKMIESRLVYSLAEAYQHFKEKLLEGLEGTIVKNPDAIWADNTSKDQVKLKLDFDADLEITHFNPGNGKWKAFFGSIGCQTVDGLLKVNVPVSGFKADDVPKIYAMREELIRTILTTKSNLVLEPSPSNKLHSLFLPRPVEFRKDKTVADTLERVLDAFNEAIANADKVK